MLGVGWGCSRKTLGPSQSHDFFDPNNVDAVRTRKEVGTLHNCVCAAESGLTPCVCVSLCAVVPCSLPASRWTR